MSKNYGEIENFAEDVVDLFNDLEIKIMDKMVDLIKENGFSGASSDYLMNRLRSLGVAEEDVAKYFEEALKGTEIKLNQIFDDEVYQEYYGHARDFKAVGYDQIPYKDNVELQQLVGGIHTQTFATIGGLSRSLGFVLRQPGTGELIPTRLQTFYQSQLDEAVLDISSGAFSYGQVIERVVNRMTNSGVRIINFESGVNRSMVSQVRTAILTGFRQIQSHINEDTAQKLGTEYFEVSYHVGARPTHQPWQGRVWSKEELTTVCGLGSVTGLCGANCYHSYLPFIPGISVRTYTDEELDEMLKQENQKKSYNGKEYTTYEALQQQRYLERTARKYRQDIKLMQRGFIEGESNDDLKDALLLKQARYQKTVAQYNDFSKKMGLPLQRDRIYKDGLGRIKVPEKTIAKRTEVFTAKDGSTRIKLKKKEEKKDDIIYLTKKEDLSGYKMDIAKGRQNKHIPGTNEYATKQENQKVKPSYLTISEEEIKKIVDQYSQKGINTYDSKGKWREEELILTNDKIIGVVVNNFTGKEQETSVFKIKYSKRYGYHIVPDYMSKKEAYK